MKRKRGVLTNKVRIRSVGEVVETRQTDGVREEKRVRKQKVGNDKTRSEEILRILSSLLRQLPQGPNLPRWDRPGHDQTRYRSEFTHGVDLVGGVPFGVS